MSRVVHEPTDRVGQQFLTRIGVQEGLQRCCMLEGRVEPLVVGRGGEHDRHPVVNRSQQLVRVRREDRTGFDGRALRGLPLLPQAGKGKRAVTLQADPQRLLHPPLDLPFGESRRNHETAPGLEGGTEGRFLRHGFRFGVNALIPDLRVLGPGRDQAPAEHDERPCGSVGIDSYGGDGLRRGDVVPRGDPRRRRDVQLLGDHLWGGGWVKRPHMGGNPSTGRAA
jgi:hypothetical protein